jgi:hypothetical protein
VEEDSTGRSSNVKYSDFLISKLAPHPLKRLADWDFGEVDGAEGIFHLKM